MTRSNSVDIRWEDTTWEGSRRVMLRRSLKLTVRERLEALEAICEVNRYLESLRIKEKLPYIEKGEKTE